MLIARSSGCLPELHGASPGVASSSGLDSLVARHQIEEREGEALEARIRLLRAQLMLPQLTRNVTPDLLTTEFGSGLSTPASVLDHNSNNRLLALQVEASAAHLPHRAALTQGISFLGSSAGSSRSPLTNNVSNDPTDHKKRVLDIENRQNIQKKAYQGESKRARINDGGSNEEQGPLAFDSNMEIRPYQAGQWAQHFEELRQYKEKFGDCLIPHAYKENPPLARWVKRQRYQYTLLKDGKQSNMTAARVAALEEIGFVWDSQAASWDERLRELQDFQKTHQHCNVPTTYSPNLQLARWVKCQRRQFKLYREGKSSNMTLDRIKRLEDLGFEWQLRTYRMPLKSN